MVAARTSGARAAGFTLIEVLVALAVAVTLAALAMPSFSSMLASQRGKSGSADLLTALTRARSEAIKRNAEVTLAPVRTSQWQQGWRIAHPSNPNAVLEEHGPLANAAISGPVSVVYLPNGRLKGSAAVSFSLTVSGNPQRRCVKVDLSGRPYQTQQEC